MKKRTRATADPAQRTPLDQLSRDFLSHCRAKGLSGKTIDQSYRPRMGIFLAWCAKVGISSIEEIDQRVMDRYGAQLMEKGGERGPLSPYTVGSYLRAVNAFLSWARKEGERFEGRGRIPKAPQRIVETLTRKDIDAIEKVAGPERDKLIVRLLADTGIRVGELCALRTGDVVERDRADYLLIQGKGHRERLVPIDGPLARRLRRHMRARPDDTRTDRAFLSQRRDRRTAEYEPLTESGVQQLVRELGRQALGRRVHPHLFRHSYITFMLQRGVDSTKIRRVVGHASTQLIDRVYGHLVEADLSDAVLTALRTKSTES